MCGIVGYIGTKPALPILLEKLENLAYRGYDSSGIAIIEGGQFYLEKMAGKIDNLKAKVNIDSPGTVGIGHTRWATHGEPTDINAHPHPDGSGNIVVVQNGIIENYLELKEWLQEKGHVFVSQTDTEVVGHLISEFYDGDIETAVFQAIRKLEGSFALAILDKRTPEKVIAVRFNPPLVIGLGEDGNYLASDIHALLKYTREILVVEDEEVAVLTRDQVRLYRFDGTEITDRAPLHVDWSVEIAKKEGYPHFMLKEIYEQPTTVADTILGRLLDDGTVVLDNVHYRQYHLQQIRRINMVACGTAYHACLVGKYVLEDFLRIPVDVDIGSEFRYRDPLVGEDYLTIVISQSGETADTIASLKEAKAKKSRVMAITNVVGSTISRMADDVLYTRAGPEIAVASTKAFTGQLTAIYLTMLYMLQHLGERRLNQPLFDGLRHLPGQIQQILDNHDQIKQIAKKLKDKDNCFFIGRNLDEPIAREGALKLKEISYIHAEAYGAGELKHGTIALIEEGMPVIALASQDKVYDKMVSNIQEVVARKAYVIAVAPEDATDIEKHASDVIRIPRTHPLLMPVLVTIPLQLLAYYTAVERGCDVDQPRNLAKSVTVE